MNYDERLPDGSKRYLRFSFVGEKYIRWDGELLEVNDPEVMKQLHEMLDKYVK